MKHLLREPKHWIVAQIHDKLCLEKLNRKMVLCCGGLTVVVQTAPLCKLRSKVIAATLDGSHFADHHPRVIDGRVAGNRLRRGCV